MNIKKNFLSRLFIFSIFFPLLFVLLFILPHLNFLAFNILVVAVNLISAIEVENIFRNKGFATSRYIVPALSISLPIVVYLEHILMLPFKLFELWLVFILVSILTRSIFTKNVDKISSRLYYIASSIVVIFYPGFFLSYIIRISLLEQVNNSFTLLFFICMVYFNDIISYLFGRFLGKNSKLNLAISPNKTLIGFISGFIMSVITAVFFSTVFHAYIPLQWWKALILGVVIGLTTIVGDLIESVMKRSAQLKDSGTIMPGRGGIMDAIDSILISAPVFYYVYKLLII